MNVSIDENLLPTLTRLASEQAQTTEEYLTSIVGSYLGARHREHLTQRIVSKSQEDIQTIEAAIDATEAVAEASVVEE
jgi:hypothetical protein